MKFSIISACRNKHKFILECYRSILFQTFTDWEWVVVDDASDDKSMKILNKLAKKNPNIKLIPSTKRLFCGSAYNLALEHSCGEIIGVVDVDDVLAIHKSMEIICGLYEKYPNVDYIYTQHDICDNNLRKIKNGVSSLPLDGKSFADMTLDKKHCYSHWRTFRRSVIQKAQHPLFKPGLKSCVDKNLGMVLEESGIGGFLNKVLYKYRWYFGNLTSMSPGGSNKLKWRKLARQFRERRSANGTKIFPVIEVY